MSDQCARLKVLLKQRHWQSHRTFCTEYKKAARAIDVRLAETVPSRAQLHRWLSGELKGLPYGDHCRILEKMFPEWTASQLFEVVNTNELEDMSSGVTPATQLHSLESTKLVTSSADLMKELILLVQGSEETLVAVGSRSREPAYLHEIEQVLRERPRLVHYRILIGLPQSQLLKDHLLKLARICEIRARSEEEQTVHISIRQDTARTFERFFVASESTAIILLPSGNSPVNFDTAFIIHDHPYVDGLVSHGKALHGKHRLESTESVSALEVLE